MENTQVMNQPKVYSVEEVIAITVHNMEELWGNIPMRLKETLADPLMGNIENLRGCINVMAQAREAEQAEKPEIGQAEEVKETD